MTKLYQKLLKPEFSSEEMKKGIEQAKRVPGNKEREAILRSVFSMIDLTSLNVTDSYGKIKNFAEKTAKFNQSYTEMSNVAALCVFPNFVVPALEGLGRSGVRLAVVSASFPTSQTFLEVKMLETEIAVRNGADE
ncbi:MAG: deoxyribose-phosphate aldolase, partial [Bacteroidales bacterium]|nr:deoxyribose-phosphate aldolase [Bacteroidales bacterium]